MPDTTTLLALTTGHLLGDVVLQPDALAERKALRRRWILVHAAVVAGVTWLLLGTLVAGLPLQLIDGLPRAGRAVGHLERMLVFLFVLIGKPEAVGFVVAAKSVFRIGDLTRRDERNHAESIMDGTLRSYAYALLLAVTVRWLLGMLGR